MLENIIKYFKRMQCSYEGHRHDKWERLESTEYLEESTCSRCGDVKIRHCPKCGGRGMMMKMVNYKVPIDALPDWARLERIKLMVTPPLQPCDRCNIK